MNVFATARPTVAENLPPEVMPVLIHAQGNSLARSGTVGSQIIEAVRRLPGSPSQAAFDFLTLALAVIASDTFVRRDDASDGWSRSIDLHIELGDPIPWVPLIRMLEKALNFLTGDQWKLSLAPDGPHCPVVSAKFTTEDSVCLFSGGLDSMIGAIHLKANEHRPLLVSHAYPKEGSIQSTLASALGLNTNHFSANVDPRFESANDTSMRARSLLFIALGVVAATSLVTRGVATPVKVNIPENGFIALNAPLTLRRIGSHSTRTTHPYFLGMVSDILVQANIPVQLYNPFELMTKGEMMSTNNNSAALAAHASETVSCGKWKRKGMQCGRCFPCIIRRAGFHAASLEDATVYRFPDLTRVERDIGEHDDLLAVKLAIRKARSTNLDTWISLGGPLPLDRTRRLEYIDVFRRGLAEVEVYLTDAGCAA